MALFALAWIAGPTAAQVTDATPPKHPTAVDPSTVLPKPAPTPVESPKPQPSHLPEPGTIALLTVAGAGWVGYWRRKWRADPKGGPAAKP